jgi:hypothetical protein
MQVEQQIREMFEIQNGLNTKSYSTTWLEKGQSGEYDYRIAGGQEIGEFLESLPVAWWSKQTADRQNCITELVDAWHFIMSQAIIDHSGVVDRAVNEAINDYADAAMYVTNRGTDLEVKAYARSLLANLYGDGLYVESFFKLCTVYGVSLDLLYARYLGKATLNKFRVENGYKVGQYAKLWDFRAPCGPDEAYADGGPLSEDNFYLSNWVNEQVDSGVVPTQDAVYSWLTETYAKVTNKPAALAA